jgi:TIR domain/SIR2-like domain
LPVLDRSVEAFLDDLLEFVEDGKVVPIIGEELLRVRQNGNEFPLYRYLADKLAQRLEIPADSLPPEPSLNGVVCHYLQTGGVPEEVYPKIRPILNQARFAPPEALLQLARIDRFKLFVTLTFDSLLATAIDQVRFGGDNRTLELAYSPKNVQDLPGPIDELRQPVVYHLLGKLSSQPDYVITDEDTLEFLHHMQSKMVASEHLFDALRDNHLLFIGCAFPDWLSRFVLRIAKSRQLSLRRTEMELLVGSLANRDTDLVLFLRHFSPRTKIASCSPAEFVAELAARYLARTASSAEHDSGAPSAAGEHLDGETDAGASMEAGAIFISYTHEDQGAARRLRDFLEEEAGVDVWLDRRRLEAGDDWDHKIHRNIKNCSYFMPLISSAATRRQEGYFRREWAWASERAMDFADSAPFIIPVVIDDTPEHADGVPERFRRAQWTRLPGGAGTQEFRRRMIALVRDYRRRPHV